MEEKDGIVSEAKRLYDAAKSHWNPIYEKCREDLLFQSDEPGAQWDGKEYRDRLETGRPAFQLDQMSQFVHQTVNDIRQQTPTINIIPDGNGADIEAAEFYKGKIKKIEYKSNADDVYDTSVLFSTKCGIGWIRVDNDYSDEVGFQQELLIKRVINPFAIYIDPMSIECDGRDARHGFALDELSLDDFKATYPDASPVCFDTGETRRSEKDGKIKIAEFFIIRDEEKTIALLDDGRVEDAKEGAPYRSTRKVKRPKVKRYKLSGQDVLEETTFPGKYIPLVPVYGEESWVDGNRELISLIRRGKAAQRMYNLWASYETEILQKQPVAPVIVAAGAIENYREDWMNPSKSMALRYDHLDAQGQTIPVPQRLSPPAAPTGIINARREMLDDIKASMGLYNASIGAKSNETSGVAIARRQQEGDVATFHFADNLNRSITQVGRILVFAIPEIYDTPQITDTIDIEDEPKQVGINGMRVEGQEKTIDLNKGKFDVRVITGASYTTKRQETMMVLNDLFQRVPDLIPTLGDIYFKNSDFTGAQAMAERMKKMLPPQLQDDKDGQAVDPQVAQLQQQLQQAQQIIQQGAAEIQSLQQQAANKQGEIAAKQQDTQVKAQSEQASNEIEILRLQIEKQKAEQDAAFNAAKLALEQKKLELEEMKIRAQTVLDQQRVEQSAQQQQFDQVESVRHEADGIEGNENERGNG